MSERKGILTPEQEKTLDRVIVFNNKIAEAADGTAIKLIDNQGLERLKNKLNEKYPEALPIVYEIVDVLFEEILDNIGKEE